MENGGKEERKKGEWRRENGDGRLEAETGN